MKHTQRFISIILALTMISTFIVFAGATSLHTESTEKITMTEYDLETGEETQKTYEIDSSIVKALSSSAVETASFDKPTHFGLYNADQEFADAGLTKVSNTKLMPYSPVGLFKITNSLLITKYGTAFMVSDNVAVTAAHCLYNRDSKKWNSGGYFYPGKYAFGIGNEPYGMTYAKKWAVCTKYIEASSSSEAVLYDWGAFVLEDAIGKKCGKLTLSPLTDEEIKNSTFKTVGYPQPSTSFNYSQYQRSISSLNPASEYIISLMPSFVGQSGSPLILGNKVCGVLSASNTENTITYFARINESAYAYLLQFIEENK